MENLNIEGTQSTPSILADAQAGTVEMRGDSYPENSFELFSPAMKWIEQFLAEGGRALTLNLHLLYLNTSSVKAMMDIFDILEDAHRAGRKVAVNWFYDEQNERVADLAEEFKEDCTFPFEITSQVE
ncbi:biofilm regulation phosphoprotein SiaC [Noviherbaspirillum denitrificans]|uniref:SiaC family regulatory phosphoprotein domain-containing protein n=1 Tax=Noviherbaspirillum denitrificans TaxID=1968433 RepID=A0A254TIC2_9BURK|nr:biofilm regulation phosphoprotein SiaC [Noviherbaspirillum denitrificans]OWW21082.1 hypothetical protein AYR66_17970 [Noviherbaspirillum denitrificans]